MSADTALVIIDVQVGMMAEAYRRDEVLAKINLLLERARESNTPVIYVQHNESKGYDLEPGTPNWQIHPAIAPREGEVIIQKASPDAFHQTRLQEELEARDIKRLAIAGMQTEYCVDTSTRRATTQGYDVTLVSDAHTTYDNKILTAEQIIAFYNQILNGFWADPKKVEVKPASEINF
jgi:nicotinamidase-related amidase